MTGPGIPLRVVWKELHADDYDKFITQSNQTPSGGGARDLRWRPHERFDAVFRLLCPKHSEEIRGRGAQKRPRLVYRGTFAWMRDTTIHTASFAYEQPTDSRPGEGRIPRIYTYPTFADAERPEPDVRTFVLLAQDDNSLVWPFIVDFATLHLPEWDPMVSCAILDCLNEVSPGKTPAGYIDLYGGTGGHCFA